MNCAVGPGIDCCVALDKWSHCSEHKKADPTGLAGMKVRMQERAYQNQGLPPKRGTPGTPAVMLGATVTTQECPGHRDRGQKAAMYSGFNLRTP